MSKDGNSRDGCGAKHLKLTLAWVVILVAVCGSLLAWSYNSVGGLRDRVEANKEQVIRNDERLKNIERNTEEIKRLLKRRP